jgi:hypothetical protein
LENFFVGDVAERVGAARQDLKDLDEGQRPFAIRTLQVIQRRRSKCPNLVEMIHIFLNYISLGVHIGIELRNNIVTLFSSVLSRHFLQ